MKKLYLRLLSLMMVFVLGLIIGWSAALRASRNEAEQALGDIKGVVMALDLYKNRTKEFPDNLEMLVESHEIDRLPLDYKRVGFLYRKFRAGDHEDYIIYSPASAGALYDSRNPSFALQD